MQREWENLPEEPSEMNVYNEKNAPSKKLKLAPCDDQEGGLSRIGASVEMGDPFIVPGCQKLAAWLLPAQ